MTTLVLQMLVFGGTNKVAWDLPHPKNLFFGWL